MLRSLHALAIVLALLAVVGAASPAPRRRLALESAVMVRRDEVRLADLLPANAPARVRAAATEISLGEAPRPGVHRTLERARVERALRATPELHRTLEVPATIDVTRWSRPLAGEEILAAIRRAFAANHFTGSDSLELKDLIFDPSIAVTEESPRLKVTSVEATPDGVGTHVRLWTSSEPRIRPFWVTLRRDFDALRPPCTEHSDCASAKITAAEKSASSGATTPLPKISTMGTPHLLPSDPNILIHRGQRVQLIVEVHGMRIMATAIPLDLGRQGDKIRVRNVDSGKVLVGTVVSAQTVEVQF